MIMLISIQVFFFFFYPLLTLGFTITLLFSQTCMHAILLSLLVHLRCCVKSLAVKLDLKLLSFHKCMELLLHLKPSLKGAVIPKPWWTAPKWRIPVRSLNYLLGCVHWCLSKQICSQEIPIKQAMMQVAVDALSSYISHLYAARAIIGQFQALCRLSFHAFLFRLVSVCFTWHWNALTTVIKENDRLFFSHFSPQFLHFSP